MSIGQEQILSQQAVMLAITSLTMTFAVLDECFLFRLQKIMIFAGLFMDALIVGTIFVVGISSIVFFEMEMSTPNFLQESMIADMENFALNSTEFLTARPVIFMDSVHRYWNCCDVTRDHLNDHVTHVWKDRFPCTCCDDQRPCRQGEMISMSNCSLTANTCWDVIADELYFEVEHPSLSFLSLSIFTLAVTFVKLCLILNDQ